MLIKIESRYGNHAVPTYINTEYIVRVSPHMTGEGETLVRIWLMGETMEAVTIAEWQRIEALIMPQARVIVEPTKITEWPEFIAGLEFFALDWYDARTLDINDTTTLDYPNRDKAWGELVKYIFKYVKSQSHTPTESESDS